MIPTEKEHDMPDHVWVRAHEDQLCTCTEIRSAHPEDGPCTGRNEDGSPCECPAFELAADQG